MTSTYPSSEFDDWAASYDRSVTVEDVFPFNGYSALIKLIVETCSPRPGVDILDLGIGTGNLSLPFAQMGCKIWGLDFSARMLELAGVKLPEASLAKVDLLKKWPRQFMRRYDCIVSAYTFHHFVLDAKVTLVKRLLKEHLAPGGRLVIGDIAFRSAAEEDALRRALGDEWEQEYYWLADEAVQAFAAAGIHASFHQVSNCAGVFEFQPLSIEEKQDE